MLGICYNAFNPVRKGKEGVYGGVCRVCVFGKLAFRFYPFMYVFPALQAQNFVVENPNFRLCGWCICSDLPAHVVATNFADFPQNIRGVFALLYRFSTYKK